MGRLAVLALTFMTLLLLGASAAQQRRVALVVGNSTYEEAGALANPANDATDVAAKLREVGFEVIEARDLGKRALERKIGEFSDALASADVGLFFYAGHGLQVNGRNFVVPVDAKLDAAVKLTLEAVPMDEILDIMEQQTETSLVFLDACRNNPFVKNLGKEASNRSAVPLQGLAQFDTTRGSFIAFSTAPGAVAMDGAGRNSPFTAALLRHIAEPGQSINDLMIAVRRDVIAETRDTQRPWEQGSLVERFEFVPQGGAVAQSEPAPSPPPSQSTEVAALERSVGNTTSIESFVLDEYLTPNVEEMRETVKRVYGDGATILGTRLDAEAIVKIKTDWFAQFTSWSFGLEPGSLKITPRGEARADAVFAMSYDYVPKDNPTVHFAGKTRVRLELLMADGQWRITSESSEALQ